MEKPSYEKQNKAIMKFVYPLVNLDLDIFYKNAKQAVNGAIASVEGAINSAVDKFVEYKMQEKGITSKVLDTQIRANLLKSQMRYAEQSEKLQGVCFEQPRKQMELKELYDLMSNFSKNIARLYENKSEYNHNPKKRPIIPRSDIQLEDLLISKEDPGHNKIIKNKFAKEFISFGKSDKSEFFVSGQDESFEGHKDHTILTFYQDLTNTK